MNNYQIFEEIGRGDHAVVYKGRKNKTIDYYGLKSLSRSLKPRILEEVRILHALDHVNVVKFYCWYETSNHLWLVLELCAGGTVQHMLKQDLRFPEATVHMLARDLVMGLHHVHSHGIALAWWSLSSFLLDAKGVLKLSGFSRARRFGTTETRHVPSHSLYTAPEVLEGGPYTMESDLWSLGCVLYVTVVALIC